MVQKQKTPQILILVSGFWIPFKTQFFNPDCPSATGHHFQYYRATVDPWVDFPKLGRCFSLSCSSFSFCYRPRKMWISCLFYVLWLWFMACFIYSTFDASLVFWRFWIWWTCGERRKRNEKKVRNQQKLETSN